MCHGVFIASKRSLPITDDWRTLEFNLKQPRDYEIEGLLDKFSLPNFYLVGSTTGCSCDLHIRDAEDLAFIVKHREPERDRVACLQAFYNLLREEAQNGAIELYSCWDGEEHLPIKTIIEFDTKTLSLDTFVLFPMQERRLIKLV